LSATLAAARFLVFIEGADLINQMVTSRVLDLTNRGKSRKIAA
jgi:hypothetical protein